MNEFNLNQKTVKKIGIWAVITICISLFIFIFSINNIFLKRHYQITVRFDFIADLKKGAAVKFVGGPSIGYIKKISRNDQKIEVLLNLTKSFNLRQNAKISMFTHGIMGERYIEISQTEHDGEYVKPGTILTGNDALSIEIFQLNLSKLTQDLLYSGIDKGEEPEDFATILRNISYNLMQYSAAINKIRPKSKTNISKFKKNTDIINKKMANLQAFSDKLKKNLKNISKKDLKSIFSILHDLENDINSLNNSLSDIAKTSESFNQQTKMISKGKTAIGELIYDDKLYDDLLDTMENLEEFSEEIVENPRSFILR